MADIKVPIRLIVETAHVRAMRDGKEIVLPQRVETQNDAACLYGLIDAVPTQEEKYKSQRRRIRRLRRDLRPMVRKSELTEQGFDGVIGEIELSTDAMKWLVDLFADPPEGVIIRGASVDTAEDLVDLYDEIKRMEKTKNEK